MYLVCWKAFSLPRRYRTAAVDSMARTGGLGHGFDSASRKKTIASNSCLPILKPAGLGRGFEPAGRGKGIISNSCLPHNTVNQMYECQQSTSTCPQNVNRGTDNTRVLTCPTNRSAYKGSCNSSTQNSSWCSRSGVVPHENTLWRPVSSTRPSFSSQGNEGLSVQVRPHNANTPNFGSKGRGRGRSGLQMHNQHSTRRPDYRDYKRW